MGIIKGSVTLTRYTVSSDLPAGQADWLDGQIRKFKFRDIEEGAEEISAGWVSPHDFLDVDFAYASWSLDPYVVLGLRVDRRRLSASLLKKYTRLEIIKARDRNQGKAPSRADRENLKDKARLELLLRLPPETAVFDVCWDTGGGQVLLGSATNWVREVFEDLFFHSFELRMAALTPWALTRRLCGSEKEKSKLEQAGPLSLYTGEA